MGFRPIPTIWIYLGTSSAWFGENVRKDIGSAFRCAAAQEPHDPWPSPHWRGETTPLVVRDMPQGATWSYRNFFVPAWHDTLHRCLYCFDPPLYTRPRGGQQHHDSQWPGSQMLLVAQILVRRNQEVRALVCRDIQQLPVAEA